MDSSQKAWHINDFLSDLGSSLMFYMSEVIDIQYQYSFFSEEYIKLFGMEEIEVHNDSESIRGFEVEFVCRSGIATEILQRKFVYASMKWVTHKKYRLLNGWHYKKFHLYMPTLEEYDEQGKGSLDEVVSRIGVLGRLHGLLDSPLTRETAPARSTMRALTEHEQRTREGVFKLYSYMFSDSCDAELIKQALEVAKLEEDMQRLYDAVPG